MHFNSLNIFLTTLLACCLYKVESNLHDHLSVFTQLNKDDRSFDDHPGLPILNAFRQKTNLMAHLDGGISPHCQEELQTFSNRSSAFISCVLDNARPLHYCSLCVNNYIQVQQSYNSMHEAGNQSCDNEIISADQIQVVSKVWSFIDLIWTTSACDKCFVTSNGTYHMRNETTQMIDMVDVTLKCFNLFSNSTTPSHSKDACTVCEKRYNEANDFYWDLDEKNMLCADLIDAMNYTRYSWGITLDCHPVYETSIGIIIISTLVALAPVLFYLIIYLKGAGTGDGYREMNTGHPSS